MKSDFDWLECSRCGKGFIEEEYIVRHDDPDDELLECHSYCCPKCNKRRNKKRG